MRERDECERVSGKKKPLPAGAYGSPIAEQKLDVAPLRAFAQGGSDTFDEENEGFDLEELGIDVDDAAR